MTMIMATHQIGFSSALADEIVFMEDGLIMEQGTPAKILSRCRVCAHQGILLQDYRALWG